MNSCPQPGRPPAPRRAPRQVPQHLRLPPLPPYAGPNPCRSCAGRKITGEHYAMQSAGGSGSGLVCEVLCPECLGCGRADHNGCERSEHSDWPDEDRDDLDAAEEAAEATGTMLCPSCHGRRWWVCQGLTDHSVHHLRVACGCATELLVPVVATRERPCRVCGCTDSRACPGGCYWVEPDLCSACATPPAGAGGWVDPVTGLVSGPIVEPEYPHKCRHCAKPIRLLPNGAWEDREGFMRCMKDLDHQPMPAQLSGPERGKTDE